MYDSLRRSCFFFSSRQEYAHVLTEALEGGLVVPVTWVKRTLCDIVQAREAHEVCMEAFGRGGGGAKMREGRGTGGSRGVYGGFGGGGVEGDGGGAGAEMSGGWGGNGTRTHLVHNPDASCWRICFVLFACHLPSHKACPPPRTIPPLTSHPSPNI